MKLLASVLAVVLTAGAVDAAVISWTAALGPENEVPSVTSSGFGSASGTVDTENGLLTWLIGWTDLTGQAVAAHFHGPATTSANAGVVVNITNISGLTLPVVGSTTITDLQVSDLLDDLWYINVHTAEFPGGEVRGQVIADPSPVPVPATLPLLLGAGLLLGALKRKRR